MEFSRMCLSALRDSMSMLPPRAARDSQQGIHLAEAPSRLPVSGFPQASAAAGGASSLSSTSSPLPCPSPPPSDDCGPGPASMKRPARRAGLSCRPVVPRLRLWLMCGDNQNQAWTARTRGTRGGGRRRQTRGHGFHPATTNRSTRAWRHATPSRRDAATPRGGGHVGKPKCQAGLAVLPCSCSVEAAQAAPLSHRHCQGTTTLLCSAPQRPRPRRPPAALHTTPHGAPQPTLHSRALPRGTTDGADGTLLLLPLHAHTHTHAAPGAYLQATCRGPVFLLWCRGAAVGSTVGSVWADHADHADQAYRAGLPSNPMQGSDFLVALPCAPSLPSPLPTAYSPSPRAPPAAPSATPPPPPLPARRVAPTPTTPPRRARTRNAANAGNAVPRRWGRGRIG